MCELKGNTQGRGGVKPCGWVKFFRNTSKSEGKKKLEGVSRAGGQTGGRFRGLLGVEKGLPRAGGTAGKESGRTAKHTSRPATNVNEGEKVGGRRS